MRIWTRTSASIQPRTSLGKSAGVVAKPGALLLARRAAREVPRSKARVPRRRGAPGQKVVNFFFLFKVVKILLHIKIQSSKESTGKFSNT